MARFDSPDPITAVLECVVAEVRIVASDRRDTIVDVRASDSAKRADVSAAEHTRVEFDAGRLLVKSLQKWRSWSLFSAGGSVDVQVQLPAGSRLTGEAAMGAFRCAGTLGECRLKTGFGDIQVEQAATVRLTTGAGNISVERVTGDAELATGSGEVRVGAIDGAALIKNSNGDTRVGEIAGEARVKAANGDVAIERSHASLTAKTANGSIRLGAARHGSIVAETGFGAVEIAIVEGTAAWLDLDTGYGHLRNTLGAAAPPQPGEDRVDVRARSGFGDITIRRAHAPAGIDPAATAAPDRTEAA